MPQLNTHAMQQKEAAIHDSTFFFVGPFDADDSLLRGSKPTRPTHMSLGRHTTAAAAVSSDSSLAASPLSSCSDYFFDEDEDDCAVLGDDDEPSEDELPPSPRRRHSGAMSISEEDLPFCYDRAALRRDTDAHRARHMHHLPQQWQQPQPQPQASRSPTQTTGTSQATTTFAAHDKWDAETDGPHMALWVPDSGAVGGESKRRRVEKSTRTAARPAPPSAAPSTPEHAQHHSSEMQGPMMALWGI